MKNIEQDSNDSLRSEYRRSDFGEMVRGKHAASQVEFAELVRLLLDCIGEEMGLKFNDHSSGNHLAGHNPGDWTYELDNANQITLRYWISRIKSVEEQISNPPAVENAQGRSHLKRILMQHVQLLKSKVDT